MDIAGMSMVMNQSKLAQDVSISVMKIAMDSTKVNANNMVDMLAQSSAMQQSVQPHLGSNIDFRA